MTWIKRELLAILSVQAVEYTVHRVTSLLTVYFLSRTCFMANLVPFCIVLLELNKQCI